MRYFLYTILGLLTVVFPLHPQRHLGARPTESGGPLIPEQAAYDITFYDLALQIFPGDSSISGTLCAFATIVQPLEWFVLDLDTVFTVTDIKLLKVNEKGNHFKWVPYSHSGYFVRDEIKHIQPFKDASSKSFFITAINDGNPKIHSKYE